MTPDPTRRIAQVWALLGVTLSVGLNLFAGWIILLTIERDRTDAAALQPPPRQIVCVNPEPRGGK